MQRTWTQTVSPDRTEWRSTDGQALVQVVRHEDGWRVELFEATGTDGLDHPCSALGWEPSNLYRSSALPAARRWVKRLTKPTQD